MVTLKNRSFLLRIGSVKSSEGDDTVTINFDIKNKDGEHEPLPDFRSFMEGNGRDTPQAGIKLNKSSLPPSLKGVDLVPGFAVPVTGDVNYEDSLNPTLKFGVSNLKLANISQASPDYLKALGVSENTRAVLTHAGIEDWVNHSRKDSSKIATIVLSEEWCNHIGSLSTDFDIEDVNPEVLDYINEIHFNSEELKDAYLSGVRDTVGYLEHVEIDVDLKTQMLEGFNASTQTNNKPKL